MVINQKTAAIKKFRGTTMRCGLSFERLTGKNYYSLNVPPLKRI